MLVKRLWVCAFVLTTRHLDICHEIETPPLTEEFACGIEVQSAANGDLQTAQSGIVRLCPGVEVNVHLGARPFRCICGCPCLSFSTWDMKSSHSGCLRVVLTCTM